jgi:hypothetical protein
MDKYHTKLNKEHQIIRSKVEHSMPQIIIIGNGPSTLEQQLGPIIDKFDIIVRINNCKVKGFEKNIGSRTDTLIMNSLIDPSIILELKPKKVIIYNCPNTQEKRIRVMQDTITRLNSSCIIEITNLKIKNIKKPTTGSIAYEYFKKRGYDPIIYGFDILNGSLDGHYWAISHKGCSLHNILEEQKYLSLAKKL